MSGDNYEDEDEIAGGAFISRSSILLEISDFEGWIKDGLTELRRDSEKLSMALYSLNEEIVGFEAQQHVLSELKARIKQL